LSYSTLVVWTGVGSGDMSALVIRLVVVHGGAGKGGNGWCGVSAAAAYLIDSVGAVVKCIRAFAGCVGVKVTKVGIASRKGVGSVGKTGSVVGVAVQSVVGGSVIVNGVGVGVVCYNPPNFSLLAPPPAAPPSPSTQPTITITQSSPPVPPQPPWTLSIPKPPTPSIPWSQHTHQYTSMELYQEPLPEPVQELVDSDMSSPSPSPVTHQSPSQPEPPPSPSYVVTEPFTPYMRTSPPGCRHNTHKLQPLEILSQP